VTGTGSVAPYAQGVDDDQRARERHARFQARNERRRGRGAPDWQTESALFSWAGAMTPGEGLPMGPAVPMPTQRQRRLGGAVLIFSFATGLSRVIGLVREVVASYYFGAHGPINAFTVAYQFPNLVRALLADAALSSAFVPVFSELIEKGERKRAWRVASSLFWLMLLGLTALSAFFILIAPWVVRLFGVPGGSETLAVGLSRVLFPIVILLGISGIVVGILNTYDHFSVPALSPVFWNLAIVAGLVLGVPRTNSINTQLYIYAFAILIATFIQVLLPMPWLRGLDRGEERLRVVIDWRDPAVKKTFKLMLPVTLGLGLININALIDVFFASRYINPDLAPTAIQKAFLIYMLPQGMFSVAIATVLFPRMARLAARGDTEGFRDTVSLGIRQITFLLFPAAVFSIVLATPVVRILFQRGAWTPSQTPVTAACLAAFSIGLVFNGAMLMLNRAFFSLQSNWIPTAVALGNLFLNALLDYLFYPFGAWGIPLSTALVNVAGTIALVYLLRREMGGIDGRRTAASAARIVLAGAIAAGISFAVWKPLDDALGHNLFITQLISLGLGLTVGIGAYFASCRLLRVRELDQVLAFRHQRPAPQ
jgi:putative peptidoglycan lipid II flippase